MVRSVNSTESLFSNYTTEQGLRDLDVTCILEDSKANLWMNTAGGDVNKFNGRTFEHYFREKSLSYNDVNSIIEDRSGNIWFSTGDKGVIKYDGTSFTQFGVVEV